jgi:hypothetical protein
VHSHATNRRRLEAPNGGYEEHEKGEKFHEDEAAATTGQETGAASRTTDEVVCLTLGV